MGQLWGHITLNAGGLFPCGIHALRYGDRTARGSAGGLNGLAIHGDGPF